MITKSRPVNKFSDYENEFVKDSYNQSWEINDVKYGHINTPVVYDSYLKQTFPIHFGIRILSVNDKDVGYIEYDINHINGHYGGKFFAHPSCTGRDLLNAIRHMICTIAKSGCESSLCKYFEFDTWHKSIVKLSQQLIPSFKEHYFYDTYRIMFTTKAETIGLWCI